MTPGRARRAQPVALALVVFFAALSVAHHAVWRAGISHHVPIFSTEVEEPTPQQSGWILMALADAQWVSSLVARHARTFLHAPHRIYDVEPCFPAEHAITLGEPMLSLGLVAAPFALFSDEPLVVYNLAVLTLTLASALAMFWLVVSFTGVPAAGIAAGVVYAFLPYKLHDVVHPYIRDTLFTVLALGLARRYFERGRLRDILLASLCAGLQMGASLYPFVAGALLGVPFLVWLVYVHGVRRARAWHVALAAGVLVLAALFVFGPYMVEAGERGSRVGSLRQFVGWRLFWPNGQLYSGFVAPVLALTGLLVPRRAIGLGERDPRPALLVGAFLCMVLAMGPVSPLGNVYDTLGSFVPGLAMVRAPGQIASGFQLVFAILSGFGAAALLRACPRNARPGAGVALVAISLAGTLLLGFRGSDAPIVFSPYAARPAQEGIDFYQDLEALGSSGPVLELPAAMPELTYGPTPPIALAPHHGRRTTTCHGSFDNPHADELRRLSSRLDRGESTDRLRALGFTTLVVQVPSVPGRAEAAARSLLAQADANPLGLSPILSAGRFHAYRLRAADERADEPIAEETAGR